MELPVDVIQFAALDDERRKLLLNVHDLMEEISYGTVVIVLQDGRVIQIETSEKIRLR
ncbi:MAG: putative small protein, partial [Actinomycetota bacterium]|nr:putative small protein [Actinomycetota bacterium]